MHCMVRDAEESRQQPPSHTLWNAVEFHLTVFCTIPRKALIDTESHFFFFFTQEIPQRGSKPSEIIDISKGFDRSLTLDFISDIILFDPINKHKPHRKKTHPKPSRHFVAGTVFQPVLSVAHHPKPKQRVIVFLRADQSECNGRKLEFLCIFFLVRILEAVRTKICC